MAPQVGENWQAEPRSGHVLSYFSILFQDMLRLIPSALQFVQVRTRPNTKTKDLKSGYFFGKKIFSAWSSISNSLKVFMKVFSRSNQ